MIKEISIYTAGGDLRTTVKLNNGVKGKYTLGSEDYITLPFTLKDPVVFEIGDWADFSSLDESLGGRFSKRYEVVEHPKPSWSNDTGGYEYNLRMDSYYMAWRTKIFKYLPENKSAEASWSYTATLGKHLAVFLRNLEAMGFQFNGDTPYNYAIDADVEEKALPLTYENCNMVDALTAMAEAWECDWWIEEQTIRFGRCEMSDAVDIEIGRQAQSMDRSDSSGTFANRLYVFGSDRNIPLTYRKSLIFTATNKVFDNTFYDNIHPLKPSYFADEYIIDNMIISATQGMKAQQIWTLKGDREDTWADARGVALEAGYHTIKFDETHNWANIGGSTVRVTLHYKFALRNNDNPDFELVLSEDEETYYGNKTIRMELPEEWEFNLQEGGTFYLAATVGVTSPSQSTAFVVNINTYYHFETTNNYPAVNLIITFQSGEYEGQTFKAILNEPQTQGNANVITMDEGYNPKKGDTFTIDNILSSLVPSAWFTADGDEVLINGVVADRLRLPKDTPYIDAYRYVDGEKVYIGEEGYDEGEEMPIQEAVEQVVVTEDIYPRTKSEITEVTYYDDEIKDDEGNGTGEYQRFYRIKTDKFTFSKDYILSGQELSVVFTSGLLNGMEFQVNFNPLGLSEDDPEAQLFELVANEDYGRTLPDTILYPEVGDEFVLCGWDSNAIIELGLVDEAEQELKDYAIEYMEKAIVEDGTYTTKLYPAWVHADPTNRTFDVGQRINLINPALFRKGRLSRVIGIELCIDIPYDNPTYTIGESTIYSRIGALEDTLDTITYRGSSYAGVIDNTGSGSGSSIYVIRTNDSTAPSNSNVYSAQRANATFLRKDKDDSTDYALGIGGGATFGNFARGYSGAEIDSKGNAEVETIVVRGKTQLKGDTSILGGLTVKGDSVMDNLSVNNLNVTGVATFFRLIVDEVRSAGGSLLLTPADGFTTARVDSDDEDDPKEFTLYFYATDGERTIENKWEVGDQAICQTFNALQGVSEEVNNKLWWALVKEVGTTTLGEGDDATDYNYIKLDWTDRKEDGIGIPEYGDEVVMLGSRSADVARQSAVYVAAYNSLDTELTAPLLAFYKGINDYDLASHRSTYFDAKNAKVIANTFEVTNVDSSGNTVTDVVSNDRGTWDEDTEYFYGDTVEYEGNIYKCTDLDGSPAGEVPEVSDRWTYLYSTTGINYDIKLGSYTSVVEIDSEGELKTPLYKIDPDNGRRYDYLIHATVRMTKDGRTMYYAEDDVPGTMLYQIKVWGVGCNAFFDAQSSVVYVDELDIETEDGDMLTRRVEIEVTFEGQVVRRVIMPISLAFDGEKGEKGEKGEDGKDGADGKDGEDGITLMITPPTWLLETDGNGQVVWVDAPYSIISYHIGENEYRPQSLEILEQKGCEVYTATINSQPAIVLRSVDTTTIYVKPDGTTTTDPNEGTALTMSVGSGYVDFAAVCNGQMLYGRILFSVSATELWYKTLWTNESFTQTYNKLYGDGGDIASLQSQITQTADNIRFEIWAYENKLTGTAFTSLSYLRLYNCSTGSVAALGTCVPSIQEKAYKGAYNALQMAINPAIVGLQTYGGVYWKPVPVNPTTKYTMAFVAREITRSTWDGDLWASIYSCDAEGNLDAILGQMFLSPDYEDSDGERDHYRKLSEDWEQFQFSIDESTIGDALYVAVHLYVRSTSTAQVACVMFQKGDFTAWSLNAEEEVTTELLATGIDIKNKVITATADQIFLQTNSGNQLALFYEDAHGNAILNTGNIYVNKLFALVGGAVIASVNENDDGAYIQYYGDGKKKMEFNSGDIIYYDDDEDNNILWILGKNGTIEKNTYSWQSFNLVSSETSPTDLQHAQLNDLPDNAAMYYKCVGAGTEYEKYNNILYKEIQTSEPPEKQEGKEAKAGFYTPAISVGAVAYKDEDGNTKLRYSRTVYNVSSEGVMGDPYTVEWTEDVPATTSAQETTSSTNGQIDK